MRRLAALQRSLILSLVLVLALGPGEVTYAVNVQTARLSRGEPSLLVRLLSALGDFLCPTVYALDAEHDHTTSATSSSTAQSLAPPKEVFFLTDADPRNQAGSKAETCEEGRFVNRDPIGIWGDPENGGNGYAFCGGNPVNGRDPFGLGQIEDEMAAGNQAAANGDYASAQAHWQNAQSAQDAQPGTAGQFATGAAQQAGGIISGIVTISTAPFQFAYNLWAINQKHINKYKTGEEAGASAIGGAIWDYGSYAFNFFTAFPQGIVQLGKDTVSGLGGDAQAGGRAVVGLALFLLGGRVSGAGGISLEGVFEDAFNSLEPPVAEAPAGSVTTGAPPPIAEPPPATAQGFIGPPQRGLGPGGTTPPGYDPGTWTTGPASRPSEVAQGGQSYYDPSGGEWRYFPGDKYHYPHWDHNPSPGTGTPWVNVGLSPGAPIYKPGTPGQPCPPTPPAPPTPGTP